MIRIAVIGYGTRVKQMLKETLALGLGAKPVAICDLRNEEIKGQMTAEGLDTSDVEFFTDADEMLDMVKPDGVMIGTRCSLHTKMAVKVLSRNITLFLEKPVTTNMTDYITLKNAAMNTKAQAVVSFPLRTSMIARVAKEILDSGKIGTVEHVQAVNNVPYGGVYYHSWYRDENETGGLFLQKATHDFDCINYLVGVLPTEVCAMTSKQIFKGNREPGLICQDCPEYLTCTESPYVLDKFFNEYSMGNICCFATDTGNEDSGSALIRYETGMHASYSQNFFVRKKAGTRGIRLMGYKGTLEFDWYTGEIKVYLHQSPKVETHKFDTEKGSHFGGDLYLVKNFLDIIKDGAKSIAPLEAGLLSALMCLKAKESAESKRTELISE